MDPRNQRQPLPLLPSMTPFIMQPLPLPLSMTPFIMQQLLELQAYTMLCEGFNGLSLCAGLVYQGMDQQHQYQYRTPSSGPIRNRRSRGFRQTEPQHPFNYIHESSGTVIGDRSTGIYPGHARIDASNNTRAGKQMRTKPYNRDRSRTWRRRTDKVDPSVYQIPTVKSKRGAMAGGPSIRHADNSDDCTTLSAASLTAYEETTRNSK